MSPEESPTIKYIKNKRYDSGGGLPQIKYTAHCVSVPHPLLLPMILFQILQLHLLDVLFMF